MQKWRDLAGRVQPPLTDRELVDMFMGTLTGPVFNLLIWSSSSGFIELILTGERVESCIKSGKISMASASTLNTVNKPFTRKKKLMSCMGREAISRRTIVNLSILFWSPIHPLLKDNHNKLTIKDLRFQEYNSQGLTCRYPKPCNTCWRITW